MKRLKLIIVLIAGFTYLYYNSIPAVFLPALLVLISVYWFWSGLYLKNYLALLFVLVAVFLSTVLSSNFVTSTPPNDTIYHPECINSSELRSLMLYKDLISTELNLEFLINRTLGNAFCYLVMLFITFCTKNAYNSTGAFFYIIGIIHLSLWLCLVIKTDKGSGYYRTMLLIMSGIAQLNFVIVVLFIILSINIFTNTFKYGLSFKVLVSLVDSLMFNYSGKFR